MNPDENDFLLYKFLDRAYPIGSIYENVVDSRNPETVLGFGVWELFAVGRVLVGLDSADSSFDTLGETGGGKTHVHTLGDGRADVSATGSDLKFRRVTESFAASARFAASGGSTSGVGTMDFKTLLSGQTDSASGLPPYTVVSRYVRVA